MAFYDSYSAGMARRPSFHGTAYSDPHHHGSYDDSFLPRQGYGEVNRHSPPFMPSRRGGPDSHQYQQYSGQTAFPAYQPPPPHVHQQFSVPREHQPSQFYSPDGDPHGFVPPPEHLPSASSMHQRRNSRGPPSFHGMPPHRPMSPSMPPSVPIHEREHYDESDLDDDLPHRAGPEMPSIRRTNSFRAQSRTPFPQRPAYGHPDSRHLSLDHDDGHSAHPVPAYAGSYEDSPLHEPVAPYFDAVPERARTISGGFHTAQPLIAPPLGAYPSKYRSRRSSTPGPFAAPIHMNTMGVADTGYMQRTGHSVAFRAKGAYQEGLSLSDATADVRLSKSIGYAFHQLHLGHRGRMMVRVRVCGSLYQYRSGADC
jgi:hypothetical protein